MHCLGLVVHPTRELDLPLGALHRWAQAHDVRVVQVPTRGGTRQVAEPGDVGGCDLIVALGGDGTTLAALHAAAAAGSAVLGVACGSLGALTATGADAVEPALDAFAAGAWTPRVLPAVIAQRDGEEPLRALNDLVLVRRGAGQVVLEVRLDGETYIRFSGDGLIAATQLGSSAYTFAARGPFLAPGTSGMVLTALAPHGGVVPPLVAPASASVQLVLDPGWGGARVEVDGQLRMEPEGEPVTLSLSVQEDYARLVTLGEQETAIAGLRRRRLLVDSPRVLARDDRAARGG